MRQGIATILRAHSWSSDDDCPREFSRALCRSKYVITIHQTHPVSDTRASAAQQTCCGFTARRRTEEKRGVWEAYERSARALLLHVGARVHTRDSDPRTLVIARPGRVCASAIVRFRGGYYSFYSLLSIRACICHAKHRAVPLLDFLLLSLSLFIVHEKFCKRR